MGSSVAGVMISADGSWKTATESNDQSDKQHDKTSNCIPDILGLPQQQPNCTAANGLPDIMDLTEEDDEMDIVSACPNECINPLLVHNQDLLSNPCTTSANAIKQNPPLQIEDCHRSGVYLPMHGSETLGGRIDSQVNGVPVSACTSYMISTVLTDAISPALKREPEGFHASALAVSAAPSQIAVPVNTPLQQVDMINEYGRFPTTSINANRIPVSVQGLPVQASACISQQRPINTYQMSPNPLMGNGSEPVFSDAERHQQPGSNLSSYQGPYMSLSSLQQQIGV